MIESRWKELLRCVCGAFIWFCNHGPGLLDRPTQGLAQSFIIIQFDPLYRISSISSSLSSACLFRSSGKPLPFNNVSKSNLFLSLSLYLTRVDHDWVWIFPEITKPRLKYRMNMYKFANLEKWVARVMLSDKYCHCLQSENSFLIPSPSYLLVSSFKSRKMNSST